VPPGRPLPHGGAYNLIEAMISASGRRRIASAGQLLQLQLLLCSHQWTDGRTAAAAAVMFAGCGGHGGRRLNGRPL